MPRQTPSPQYPPTNAHRMDDTSSWWNEHRIQESPVDRAPLGLVPECHTRTVLRDIYRFARLRSNIAWRTWYIVAVHFDLEYTSTIRRLILVRSQKDRAQSSSPIIRPYEDHIVLWPYSRSRSRCAVVYKMTNQRVWNVVCPHGQHISVGNEHKIRYDRQRERETAKCKMKYKTGRANLRDDKCVSIICIPILECFTCWHCKLVIWWICISQSQSFQSWIISCESQWFRNRPFTLPW